MMYYEMIAYRAVMHRRQRRRFQALLDERSAAWSHKWLLEELALASRPWDSR
jgi:hypothetical protein